MYVCLCRAVNDRTIKGAIAGGARSIDDIILRTSAGSRCGGCWPALRDLLAEAGVAVEDVALNDSHHAA